MTDECFSVDVSLDETWLLEALESVRKGGTVRVTVVISNPGPNTKWGAKVVGGRDAEYLLSASAGDLTKDPEWQGSGRQGDEGGGSGGGGW